MESKTKTAPDVRAIESGEGTQISGQTIGDPDQKFITCSGKPQVSSKAIVDFLPQGIENAMSTQTLMSLCGCSSARQLQERIATERARGSVILSSSTGGYFLPDAGEKGRQEIQAYIATLNARAVNTLSATKSAKEALAVLDGQLQMDGEELAKT